MEQHYSRSTPADGIRDGRLSLRLHAAQRKIIEGPIERRAAVMDALNAGWSLYRIAKELDVDESTVRSIRNTARKLTSSPEEQS